MLVRRPVMADALCVCVCVVCVLCVCARVRIRTHIKIEILGRLSHTNGDFGAST